MWWNLKLKKEQEELIDIMLNMIIYNNQQCYEVGLSRLKEWNKKTWQSDQIESDKCNQARWNNIIEWDKVIFRVG